MVSSSHVGDAISVRCDDAGAVKNSATATTVKANSGDLATMMIPADHHLAIRPGMQGRADPVRTGGDLLLEATNALHEELVEDRARDREEFHPFEQLGAVVLRFVKDPLDEGEPAQLAIEAVFGSVELGRWALFAWASRSRAFPVRPHNDVSVHFLQLSKKPFPRTIPLAR